MFSLTENIIVVGWVHVDPYAFERARADMNERG